MRDEQPMTINEETDPATRRRTDWFVDARFGMFVHWGLYSLPAGVWDGVPMGRNGYAEWIQTQGDWPRGIPADAYRALAGRFDPRSFDARAWADAAANAGMRYLVLTAKHHDGFALWPSRVSRYNVADATPFGRDVLGELKTACDAAGIRLGCYYSHWLDWEHPHGGRPHAEEFHSEPRWPQPSQARFEEYWQGKCLPQVAELLDRYDPALLWFDTWAANSSEWIDSRRIETLVGLVRSRRPDCLINSRIGTWGHPDGNALVDLVSTHDNSFPETRIAPVWETSGTMNGSWGHHRLDHGWKPTRALLRNLIRNAARGGNYQLNVGPTADGTFPAPATRRLREIGAWMAVHAEAIRGTTHSPVGAQPWGEVTRRERTVGDGGGGGGGGERWYLHLLEWEPGSPLTLTGTDRTPAAAFVLETGQPVEFARTTEGIRFVPPAALTPGDLPVIALDLA